MRCEKKLCIHIRGDNAVLILNKTAPTVSPYINVAPAAMYVCEIEQAQSLQRAVTMLQSNLHGFLQKSQTEHLR